MIGPVPTTTICECTNACLQFGEKFHLDKITRISCTSEKGETLLADGVDAISATMLCTREKGCLKGVPFEHEKRDA